MLALLVFAALWVTGSAQASALLPKNWQFARVASNAPVSHMVRYMVVYNYYSSATCGGEDSQVHGIRLDTCMLDYDICGTFLGTAKVYSVAEQDPSSVTYSVTTYHGSTCAPDTKHMSETVVVASGCVANSSTTSSEYVVVTSKRPWVGVNKGVVTKSREAAFCAQDPATWTSMAFNVCFYDSACGHGGYFMFTDCDADGASIQEFEDMDCTQSYSRSTIPTDACDDQEVDRVWSIALCNN